LRGITPKSVLEHLLFAVIGGVTYMLIEIAWRGYTHWSMGILGGVCFVLVGLLDEVQQHPPLIVQMAQGAVICTVLELLAGLDVWDYSSVPGNLMGQVCPQFTIAWAALSAVAVWVEDRLHDIFD
jgi:hypothetical protein